MDHREFDLILWGASGFTGRLVAGYLARRATAGALRWALGGRDPERLDAVRQELGIEIPAVVADAADQPSLDALAARTRVVCSTVGPYALYGSKLVAACVHQGTHYCDLTGEIPWMRRMIDTHHVRARETGARIVHTCGFDSIPSDLGTWLVNREMQERHGVHCAAVHVRVRSLQGGVSGGTVASLLNVQDESERDPGLRALLADPYALNPEGERGGLDGPGRTLPEYDGECQAWVAPFVMAAINSRVVRRSNALLDYAYGRDFRYDEGLLMPFGPFGFPLAAGVSLGVAAGGAVASIGALRRRLAAWLPQPGQGPDAATRAGGHFHIEVLGLHPADPACNLRVVVRGDQDPGYGSTSQMLGEAALCLARDELPGTGGVLTPAVAMGGALLQRLNEHAGVTFGVA